MFWPCRRARIADEDHIYIYCAASIDKYETRNHLLSLSCSGSLYLMVMECTGHALHNRRMVVMRKKCVFSEAAFALFSTGMLEISEVIACLLRPRAFRSEAYD